jgi:hypothetical protein
MVVLIKLKLKSLKPRIARLFRRDIQIPLPLCSALKKRQGSREQVKQCGLGGFPHEQLLNPKGSKGDSSNGDSISLE